MREKILGDRELLYYKRRIQESGRIHGIDAGKRPHQLFSAIRNKESTDWLWMSRSIFLPYFQGRKDGYNEKVI